MRRQRAVEWTEGCRGAEGRRGAEDHRGDRGPMRWQRAIEVVEGHMAVEVAEGCWGT